VRRPHGQPLDLTAVDDRFRDRFWSKVAKGEADDCWLWLAHRKASGYGQFTVRKGVFMTSSRVALALSLGRPLESGEVACHVCDNPPCCNPAHLFAGTQRDNALDSVVKGRARRARGVDTASARLTEDDVRAIRAETDRWGLNRDLSVLYGVSNSTIAAIRMGQKWKHVA
jgi:hypothetical protein